MFSWLGFFDQLIRRGDQEQRIRKQQTAIQKSFGINLESTNWRIAGIFLFFHSRLLVNCINERETIPQMCKVTARKVCFDKAIMHFIAFGCKPHISIVGSPFYTFASFPFCIHSSPSVESRLGQFNSSKQIMFQNKEFPVDEFRSSVYLPRALRNEIYCQIWEKWFRSPKIGSFVLALNWSKRTNVETNMQIVEWVIWISSNEKTKKKKHWKSIIYACRHGAST